MKTRHSLLVILAIGMIILGINRQVIAGEALFKDFDTLIVNTLEVTPNISAPEGTGVQMADKVVSHARRYSQKYHLFETIVRDETGETPADKKILLIKGAVTEYTQPTVRRRIGRALIPGGEFTGSAAVKVHYQFVDKENGQVVYETDLRTTSTGSNDTIEYAMERNGEALAKIITKYKGK